MDRIDSFIRRYRDRIRHTVRNNQSYERRWDILGARAKARVRVEEKRKETRLLHFDDVRGYLSQHLDLRFGVTMIKSGGNPKRPGFKRLKTYSGRSRVGIWAGSVVNFIRFDVPVDLVSIDMVSGNYKSLTLVGTALDSNREVIGSQFITLDADHPATVYFHGFKGVQEIKFDKSSSSDEVLHPDAVGTKVTMLGRERLVYNVDMAVTNIKYEV